jgi:hypothetical protein
MSEQQYTAKGPRIRNLELSKETCLTQRTGQSDVPFDNWRGRTGRPRLPPAGICSGQPRPCLLLHNLNTNNGNYYGGK